MSSRPDVVPPVNSWTTDLSPIGFVGAGAVATTLAGALSALGAQVSAVTARTPASAATLAAKLPACQAVATTAQVATRATTVILAVPDDALAPICASIPWQPGQIAIHLSGARGLAPLAPAATSGAHVAALHPLMTFPPRIREWPTAQLMERIAGCAWALEAGDLALAATLGALVRALGGHVVALAGEQRVPYHLAAVLASNYVVALLGAAVQLWQTIGVAPEEALSALLPLTRATVESLETSSLPAALTGPIARGDVGTVAAHLAWLRAHVPDDPALVPLAEAYRALGRLALPLALARGTLSPEAAAALQVLLDSPDFAGDPSRDKQD